MGHLFKGIETWVVAAKPYATDIFPSIFKCFVPVDLKKNHETALESHQRVELSKSHLQKFYFQKVARKKISKFESRELLKNWWPFFCWKRAFPEVSLIHCISIAMKWSADSRQALDHLVLILPALNMALSCEVAETRCSKKGTFHCLRRWERLGKRCVFSIWILLGIFHFQINGPMPWP